MVVAAGDFEGADSALKQALMVAGALKSASRVSLQAQRASLEARQRCHQELAALKARLEKDPQDGVARAEIVRRYVVEEDDPATAATFDDPSLDEATRKFVAAAAKGVEAAPEYACPNLADWYRGLAEKTAAPAAKAVLLRHARRYYARFLELHHDEDLTRATVAVSLRKVEEVLGQLGYSVKSTALTAAWTDCLRLTSAEEHATNGRWAQRGSALRLEEPSANCGINIPVTLQGRYELDIAFVRTTGSGSIGVCLPVGTTACEIILGPDGAAGANLERVNGSRATGGPDTVQPNTLSNGQEYGLAIKVLPEPDAVEITADLDGRPCLRWRGPAAALAPRNAWGLPDPGRLGLSASGATVEFRHMRVRSVPDVPKPVPEAPEAGAKNDPKAAETKGPKAVPDKGEPRLLFNGKDLAGWDGKPPAWFVDAAGVLTTRSGGQIVSADPFGNFILELDVKFDKDSDAGLFLRAADPKDPAKTGIEVQLVDRFGMGSNTGVGDCGALTKCVAPAKNVVRPPGQWNHLAVAARDSRIQVSLNGEVVVDADLTRWVLPGINPDGTLNPYPKALKDMAREGHIALRNEKNIVYFRNIRLKPL